MLNQRGQTVQDRLIEEIEHAESVQSVPNRNILATRALGAADLAVEFGLITYNEWEQHIDKIFSLI